MQTFDLIVIGSGPAGQRAAVQAAKLERSVAVVERARDLGGVCINTGTIPSKTLREAILDLSGRRQQNLYGEGVWCGARVRAGDLLKRTEQVMRREREVIRSQLQRNGVQLLGGTARFEDPHVIAVEDGERTEFIRGEHVAIAVGTSPAVPPGVPVDHKQVLTSDDILCLELLPKTLAIVGAGVIGVEYATMFAALGVQVTLVEKRAEVLEMVDKEIVETLFFHAREMGLTLRLGEEVQRVEVPSAGKVVLFMKSGKRLPSDMVLFSAGRQGVTAPLRLEKAGLSVDARGRIAVNERYATAVPHIYAVGDVIGFPSLASTSMEQGRLAACHMFGAEAKSVPELYPFGIYAIPEIGWVGASEADLTAKAIPFETGIARYKEIARGHILGDPEGMLKLIFHLDTRKILGVFGLGTGATELVHIGQAVMALNGTLDYFISSVFNYPTLAECYKVAALDGLNKLRRLGALPPGLVVAVKTDPTPYPAAHPA